MTIEVDLELELDADSSAEPLTLEQLLDAEVGTTVGIELILFGGTLLRMDQWTSDPLSCAEALLPFGLEPGDVLGAQEQIAQGQHTLERVELVETESQGGSNTSAYTIISGHLTVVLAAMAGRKELKAKIWPPAMKSQAIAAICAAGVKPVAWSAFRTGMFICGLFSVDPVSKTERSVEDVALMTRLDPSTISRYRKFAAIEPVLLRAFSSVHMIRLSDAAKIVDACSTRRSEVLRGALHCLALIKSGHRLAADTTLNLLLGEPPGRAKPGVGAGAARVAGDAAFEEAANHVKHVAGALADEFDSRPMGRPIIGQKGEVGRVLAVGPAAALLLSTEPLGEADLEAMIVALGKMSDPQ